MITLLLKKEISINKLINYYSTTKDRLQELNKKRLVEEKAVIVIALNYYHTRLTLGSLES